MSKTLSPEIEAAIAAQEADLIRIRHELHAHPQLGFEETFAAELVQRELKSAGVPFQAGVAQTGVVGWLTPSGAKAASAARSGIALRADMDALLMTEETGLPYASVFPGYAHACGHDGHVAILIGAARVLAGLREKLPRPVKLLFQPAEEALGGGEKMVQAGVLEERIGGFPVSEIFALHGFPTVDVGCVATRVGPLMAGADHFAITLRGRGGHGAMPHLCVDPVLAAAHVVTALQSVVSRNVPPTAPAVVTVGKLEAGTAINIIPDSARIEGTIRTFDDGVAELVHKRMTEVARQVAAGLGCSADVKIRRYYPVTANEPRATEHFLRVARDVLGESAIREAGMEMGAEDFSFYLRKIPGCYLFLGIKRPGQDRCPPNHSPQFDFADETILTGVRLMVALSLAEERVLREEETASSEFHVQREKGTPARDPQNSEL